MMSKCVTPVETTWVHEENSGAVPARARSDTTFLQVFIDSHPCSDRLLRHPRNREVDRKLSDRRWPTMG